MRPVLVVVGSFAAVVLGACSLISTAGLSGGADAPGDAASAAETSAKPNEGGADAPPVAPDGAVHGPFVCPAGALLCDDFERPQAAGNGWEVDGTFPSLSSQVALSPTRSLAVALPSNGQWNFIRRLVNPVPTRLRVSFGLYAGTAAVDFYEIVKLAYGDNNNWETFTLALTPEGLHASTQYYDNSTSPTPRDAKTAMTAAALYGTGWHAVVISIDVRNNPRVASIAVDGAAGATVNLTSTRPAPTYANVTMGVTYGPAGKPLGDAYIDDVVLRAE